MNGFNPTQATDPRMIIQFEDNRLLPSLFGEHDRHLAQIETALGVVLVNRGNRIAINGSTERAQTAKATLDALYRQLDGGHEIDGADVDAALRMAVQPADLFGAQEPTIQTRKRRITPRSPRQADYIRAIYNHDLTFGLGPAGTGKTYLAVCCGVAMYLANRVARIIFTRPAVEAGERLGFLPGDMRDKVDPYLRPVYDALHDTMSADQAARKIAAGDIEIAPLAFMRGRTLSNAFVLVDEAQNTTPMQMKMLLTRLGDDSRMVINGDLTQIDLPEGQASGLCDALTILDGVEGPARVHFDASDVVRHPLVARIVRAYGQHEHGNRHGS